MTLPERGTCSNPSVWSMVKSRNLSPINLGRAWRNKLSGPFINAFSRAAFKSGVLKNSLMAFLLDEIDNLLSECLFF